eukprot:TRINITY_DN31311_c0_g1_i1.p1 TRINITY_DN31311_c0_g1~~TRINITY_DN31311_c0_g1_i1.p1  ORF type:complete len:804 (-),score=93.04 TRINITY_DN31311_c0_g1_i1:17-2359(-)
MVERSWHSRLYLRLSQHALGFFACFVALGRSDSGSPSPSPSPSPSSSSGGSSNGLSSCRCLEWSGLDAHIYSGKLIYTPPGSQTSYQYPQQYGVQQCDAHDKTLPPFCDRPSPPDWCFQRWCFIDRQQCTGVQIYDSSYWPGKVYYSYETCGSSNSFTLWYNNGMSAGNAGKLLDILEGYLWSSRYYLEQAYLQLSGQQLSQACYYAKMCPCLECFTNTAWKAKISLGEAGGFIQTGISSKLQNVMSCLVGGVSQTYNRIAAKESDSGRRVGYMYFGDQLSGSTAWWPNVDWCPTDYDPRLRPWYAAASTGPKDVVIVVDVSGSMGMSNRYVLAEKATEALLDTLDWKDYASIILFNHGIAAEFSSKLVPVDSCTRSRMKAWLKSQNWKEGGTNFVTAMNRAFEIISASVAAGETSMCQKAILFLTDGEAEYSTAEFASTRSFATRYDTHIFTYALGTGANKVATKQLACENRGIFYRVPDGADLVHIMAQYYSFFASGQEVCKSTFTAYTDVVTGAELWPACLPLYDRSSSQSQLLGVTCMDINVIADPSSLKGQAGWSDFTCKMSDMTKQCRPMYLSECHLEKMRQAYSSESVCSYSNIKPTCPCVDPNCQDDEDFIDEKGYFCDTWIGDDCAKAQEQWSYTWDGQQSVLNKCKKSCGKCQVLDPCPFNSSSPCQGHTFSTAASSRCRACRTSKVSGLDIQGKPMCCPELSNCQEAASRCPTPAPTPASTRTPSPASTGAPTPASPSLTPGKFADKGSHAQVSLAGILVCLLISLPWK